MKVKSLVKYVGLASLALGANASFASLTFDADGAGGDAAVQVDQFDWGTTNFLALGGTTAISNFQSSTGTCREVDCTFKVYSHASLVNTSLADNTQTTPTGLGSVYEITMTLTFTEVVTAVSGTQANFSVVTGAGARLQIFYDVLSDPSTASSNMLTGQGFNDGILIADANVIQDSTGLFVVIPTVGPLDMTNGGSDNDYPGIISVSGIGIQQTVTMEGFTLDDSFFLTALADFSFLFENISQTLPFRSVDPSSCFTGTPSAVGVDTNVVQTSATANCDGIADPTMSVADTQGGITPDIGIFNGVLPANGGGPDFIAQTDFNSPVTGTVPVPAPLALLGVGLLGLGWNQRKKRS